MSLTLRQINLDFADDKIKSSTHPQLGFDLFTSACDQPQPLYFYEEGRERTLATRLDVRFSTMDDVNVRWNTGYAIKVILFRVRRAIHSPAQSYRICFRFCR